MPMSCLGRLVSTAAVLAVPVFDVALAQTSTASTNALINASPRALQLLDEFKLNPAGPISRNPNGGGALAAEIRDILVADKTQLGAILAIVPQGTAAQQEALGSGLGLARLLYIRDAEFTSEIQTRVVELDNKNVLTGFSIFGGGGVAALFGNAPPAAPALVLGPVGPVASAPAANSQGRGGGGGGSGGDGGGGIGGGVRGTSRGGLGALRASP
jgi:hypothetical protein